MKPNTLLTVVLVAVLGMAMLGIAATVAELAHRQGYADGWRDGRDAGSRSVPCPSEDSCVIDYRDGAWHVSLPGETGE